MAAERSRGFWILAGAANGLLAVAIGAFAAHGARAILPPAPLGWVRTGAEYQMWHGLALLAVAALGGGRGDRTLALAGALFLIGILLFSGSLYLLAFAGWLGFAWITPFGGVALLLGWAALAWHGIARMRAA